MYLLGWPPLAQCQLQGSWVCGCRAVGRGAGMVGASATRGACHRRYVRLRLGGNVEFAANVGGLGRAGPPEYLQGLQQQDPACVAWPSVMALALALLIPDPGRPELGLGHADERDTEAACACVSDQGQGSA